MAGNLRRSFIGFIVSLLVLLLAFLALTRELRWW